MPHDTRDEVVDYVGKWSGRTELSAKQLVRWIGVGMSKFYDWRQRYGKVNEHNAARAVRLLISSWNGILRFPDGTEVE